jgi:hypothetical protein
VYIIAGDSWACGEWGDTKKSNYQIEHKGLAQYLHNNGHIVFNLGLPGGSNLNTIHRLEYFLETFLDTSLIEKIFVFQTEWIRDYQDIAKVGQQKELPDLGYINCKNFTISEFYYSLSDLCNKYSVSVDLIGGCSDVLYLDNFQNEYPGCNVICQSLTNLCLFNDHRIQDPVFNLKPDAHIISKIKKNSDNKDIERFLLDQENAETRLDSMKQNKEWFFPDGVHANRHAHRKLFDFIISKFH